MAAPRRSGRTRAARTRPPVPPIPSKRSRFTRDGLLFANGIALLWYEVTFGGGRVAVLTTVAGLLVSPAILRIEEARRSRLADEEVPR